MELSYFNIQKFSLHDGPGIRTTVFLKGCPLGCVWCHNPESRRIEPQLMFNAEKCTVCGRCIGLCDARGIADGRVYIEREKCIACGRCEERCLYLANSVRGEKMSVEAVFDEVKRDKAFYDNSGGGMTISGGEPSMPGRGRYRSCGACAE